MNCTTKPVYFSPAECQAVLFVPSDKVLDQFQQFFLKSPQKTQTGINCDFIDIAIKSTPSSSALVLKSDGRGFDQTLKLVMLIWLDVNPVYPW